MSIPRTIGTDYWLDANPKKFGVYNAQFDESGKRFPSKLRMPWVAIGGDYYRSHETFQDALNYALDMGALI